VSLKRTLIAVLLAAVCGWVFFIVVSLQEAGDSLADLQSVVPPSVRTQAPVLSESPAPPEAAPPIDTGDTVDLPEEVRIETV